MASLAFPARRACARIWFPLTGLLACLLAASPAAGARQIERELALRGLEISADFSGAQAWTDVALPGAMPEVAVGDPAIPSIRVTLPIDPGFSVTGAHLVVLADEVRQLPNPVRPYGGEQSSRDAAPPSAVPNPARYAAAEPFPGEQVRFVREFELSGGQRFATFLVHPLSYIAATGQLHWIQSARLVVDLQEAGPGSTDLHREREPLRLALGAPAPSGRVVLSQPGFAPAEAPSMNGSLVEYVIVSPDDEEMVAEWQRLADWKTACGHPAVVRTVSWIADAYPTGSDLAESIRMFLHDCYVHWGLRWALLGGDTDTVPCRYARSWFYNPSNSDEGTDVACDFYYASLEGTWDYDADGIFGESFRAETQPGGPQEGDKVDFSPEIHVGRISARSAQEVEDYLDKYFIYVQTPGDEYLDRILMLGEVLFHSEWSITGLNGGPDCDTGAGCNVPPCRPDDLGQPICAWYDGATDCFDIEMVLEGTGVGLDPEMLLERYNHWRVTEYEGRVHPNGKRETLESVLSAISDGYGIVQHVGHGDRDRWMVGEGRMMLGDIASLTNGEEGRYYLCYGVNCSSAAIDYDCFGEEMVRLPGHGAIGYIGCSNVDFPTSARGFTADFYDILFSTPGSTVGDAYFGSAAANGPDSTWQNDYPARFLVFTMVLLGEPGMMVWRGTPGELDLAFNTSPGLGAQTLGVTVTSNGSPVPGATVCVQKEDEIYVVAQTGADGEVDIPFWPQSAGEFEVTATSATHRPESRTGTVTSSGSGSQLVLEDLVIRDDGTHGSSGNGNGRLEVGETARLAVPVRNAGNQTLQSVNLTLSLAAEAPTGLVTVTDGVAAPGGGTISAGQTATDEDGFLLAIAAAPPAAAFAAGDAVTVPFSLQVASSAGTSTGTTYLDVTRPRLEPDVSRMVDVEHPQDRRNLYVGILNNGKGTATDYTATLSAQNIYVSVVVNHADLSELDPGATTEAGPFTIDVLHEGYARLEFEIEDASGNTVHARTLDLKVPSAPESLAAIGLPGAVTLMWGEASDPNAESILGYKVQRAPEGSTEFSDAHEGLITGHRYMNDSGLEQLAEYSYKVAAVDASGYMGDYTPASTVFTSPGMASGWPGKMATPTPASPLICELDGWYSTGREIIFCGDDLYAYHGSGSEIADGDNVGSTMGIFSTRGSLFYGKAAAGDINGDGQIELLAISKASTSGATDGDTLYCWSGDKGRKPLWAVKLQNNISWNTPVLADLDGSGDGRLEVILCAGTSPHAGIYVFRHDGRPAAHTNSRGLLLDLSGHYLYSPPAVGDVDGDGSLEIVAATRQVNEDGALWVVRADGSTVNPFNRLLFSTLGLVAHQGTTASPTVANVDGGTDEEIFVVTPDYILAFKNNRAQTLWAQRLDATFDREVFAQAPLGDIDGDGDLDLAVVDWSGRIWALDARTGNFLSNFHNLHVPRGGTVRYGSCILADVDGNARPEIIFGDDDRYVYAYTKDGVPARGFPVFVGGRMRQQSMAAWDVDNDGYQNLVIQGNYMQQLLVLDLTAAPFDPRHNPWPMRYRDDRNTGRYVQVTLDANWPVAIQMTLEEPIVSAEGTVQLKWSSPEPVLSFRIHRALAQDGNEELVGVVPGRSGAATQTYAFEDTPPGPGLYRYRISPVGPAGRVEEGATVLAEIGLARPLTLQLRGVFPNPLRPARSGGGQVVFALPGRSGVPVDVQLRVIDLQGRLIRRLLDDSLPPGVHTAHWDGRDDTGQAVPTGLYLLKLDAGEAADSRRVLLVR